MSHADDIAKVVADLKAGRIRYLDSKFELWKSWRTLFNLSTGIPVIDATRIYKSIMRTPQIDLYGDHVLRPPWMDAFICYQNQHGNVHVMHTMCSKADDRSIFVEKHYQPDDQEHTIEWDRVEWVYTVTLWMGGYGNAHTKAIQTCGPVHAWVIPVYGDDGRAADIRWVQLTDPETEMWENNMLVVLQTLNFMNCVNVELAEPHRDRMARKRIRRLLGETEVTEIRVRPVSKTYSGEHYDHKDFLVPLHSVRGHMAHYGPEYGRKLLFGKYSGRFWIQQHVRGSESLGKREHKYIPEPEDES